jgi:hypothetical protein
MAGQQLAGPPLLIPRGIGIIKQFGSEAAVQVPLQITPILLSCGRIANHQFKGQAMALQLVRVLTPLVEEPQAIALIAMGSADQQNAPLPMVAIVAAVHRRPTFLIPVWRNPADRLAALGPALAQSQPCLKRWPWLPRQPSSAVFATFGIASGAN